MQTRRDMSPFVWQHSFDLLEWLPFECGVLKKWHGTFVMGKIDLRVVESIVDRMCFLGAKLTQADIQRILLSSFNKETCVFTVTTSLLGKPEITCISHNGKTRPVKINKTEGGCFQIVFEGTHPSLERIICPNTSEENCKTTLRNLYDASMKLQ